ncbi:hypothetical protein PFISCL1PPCAC_25797 [Pristionchus fissidentatus]|uniref:Uncharacterized protein n=1 Tax=Pristionchus fissidentatus TaxID=1538716 RepID=A0AAV5WV94_9BILA|nr:hypothetical protein PFISCL1PPCAC_25797 [Pristionchus fissidentatus]
MLMPPFSAFPTTSRQRLVSSSGFFGCMSMTERKLEALREINTEENWKTGATALMWSADSLEFVALATALQTEIVKLTQTEVIVCWDCIFHMYTSVNLVDHLIDPHHMERLKALNNPVLDVTAQYMNQVLAQLSNLLKRTLATALSTSSSDSVEDRKIGVSHSKGATISAN